MFSSSSSTSSDEELATALIIYKCATDSKKKKKVWTKPWLLRRNDGTGRGVISMLHNELRFQDKDSFKNFLRMDERTFNILLERTQHLYTYVDTKYRQCISPRDRLTATLRYLATGQSLQSLSYTFRIGRSTLCKIVKEVMEAICDCLGNDYLKMPSTKNEWKRISNEFFVKWNIPNCIGAIDGKHINFRPLRSDGSLYRNYKGTDSLVLMAVVGPDYKFLGVDIGGLGRISDGGIFNDSRLSKAFYENSVNIPEDNCLPNRNKKVPYLLIGDDAFPLSTRLIKPFRHHGLSKEKRIYNYRISRARRVVENAFGILANRFRILLVTILSSDTNKIEKVTACCCILHNFLCTHLRAYKNLDDLNKENIQYLKNIEPSKTGNRSSAAAIEIRNEFVQYFNNEGTLPWQEEYINK